MSGLREGFTTGTCAAAAAKAAALLLATGRVPETVEVPLPDGSSASLPVLRAARLDRDAAEAAVLKDAGSDPDITHRSEVVVTVQRRADDEVSFAAGEGVGTVTRAGLAVAPGEPAINPVPRKMIADAVRPVLKGGAVVTVSIPGGRELAAKTFNPRLGIVGGLSILGTSGRVRPFSHPALQASLKCAVEVAACAGIRRVVLVPGHIGERAARANFRLEPEQILEVANEWGFVLDLVAAKAFSDLLLVGHPGKLAKLGAGQWDTHSSRSESAVPLVARSAGEVLGRALPDAATVEALFAALAPEERLRVAEAVAGKAAAAVSQRLSRHTKQIVAVVLVDLKGRILGSSGDLSAWR